jgi:diguanylate cyclase (GGDEF)-like protein
MQRASEVTASDSRLRAELSSATEELARLYAAFENIESGILLLDGDLHAQFSNSALHAMFNSLSPQYIAARKPHYSEMLRHARSASAYAVAAAELEEYVARRLAWVISGNPTPIDQHLFSGRVIRSQTAVLPGGGRMLTYNDVTDIVRNAEELERLATTDGMTGIYNRRHFLTLADHEWGRSRRYGRELSFLMIDIDYFKKINDGFGHEIGDRMIVHLTNLANSCKRVPDVLARIGGEEFAMLLPETDLTGAEMVAERLRCEVVENPLVVTSGKIPATVSIGVATVDSAMTGISDLMKAADQALYQAKRGGRNRVVCQTG